jgi:hypothetical protein
MVTGELETLRSVVAGRSIARYGDGELKMAAHDSGIKSQGADGRLSQRLREILHDSGDCLVGIPNLHSATPKAEFWNKHRGYARLLADRPYVSSFISRPDSAPWIDTDEYWDLLESLWRGQDVTVVRGSHKSLAPDDIAQTAGRITDVVCRKQHAFQDYDEILDRIGTPKRALICLGPTATVLAVDLCARGVHAIDLGHVAIFMRKRRRGEPLSVTDSDRAVDREATVA